MQTALEYVQHICLPHCIRYLTSPNNPFSCPSSYLSEDEGLLVVGWVQSVVHHHTCAKLLPDGVCRQPVHVDLHIRADFLV